MSRTPILFQILPVWLSFAVVPIAAVGQEPEKEPKLLTSYQDVLEVLNGDSVLHQADNKNQSIRIPTRRRDLDGVMIIRWQARDGVVQFIQSMPMEVPEERVKSVETAMMRLNHALAIPGFAINHENRLPYYRFVVPFQPRGGIQADEFRSYFQVTLKQAAGFFGPLKQVAEEGADPVEVTDKIRRTANDRKAAGQRPAT
ncbi:MAG: YbjN domain-containing protein [Planctomycetota bacterium]|nr:YbjN domain-containing protein [Planctomycetota bacterium]